MDDPIGMPPRHGWARMMPEPPVNDLARSLAFRCHIVGLAIAYQRRREGFVCLNRQDGARVRLCQRPS